MCFYYQLAASSAADAQNTVIFLKQQNLWNNTSRVNFCSGDGEK